MVLSETDLTRNFNPMVLIRAREYERSKKVLKAHIETGGWIYGLVKGSDFSPYGQIISYRKEGSGYTITGECSCPTGKNCKHIAAVIFHLIGLKAFDKQPAPTAAALAPTNPMLERWLASVKDSAEDHDVLPEGARQELLFVLKVERIADRAIPILQPITAQIARDGSWSQTQPFRIATLRAQTAPRYLRRSDVDLLKRLEAHLKSWGENVTFDLSSIDAPALLQQVLDSGRCLWASPHGTRLHLGQPAKVESRWVQDELGFQKFKLRGIKGKILPLCPPWYADPVTGACGLLETGLNPRIAQALCSAPTIAPEHAARVRDILASVFGQNSPLLPCPQVSPEVKTLAPTPTMRIGKVNLRQTHSNSTAQKSVFLPGAQLGFKYGGHPILDGQVEMRASEGGRQVVYPRKAELEANARDLLEDAGWTYLNDQGKWERVSDEPFNFILDIEHGAATDFSKEQHLLEFLAVWAPKLKDLGWELEWDQGPSVNVAEATFSASIKEADGESVRLSLAAEVGEEGVDLLPILKRLEKNGFFSLDPGSTGNYYLQSDSGTVFVLPEDKMREIVSKLAEIFGENHRKDLLLPKVRSFELQEFQPLLDRIELPNRIGEAIQQLASPTASFTSVLGAEFEKILRPYQKDGVSWLGFLASFGFGGILADDMGLGKTLQTLAHIQSLKLRGKLTRPCLIVAPTSTLPNWRAEMKRFVPDLQVLVLHGSDRKELFEEIERYEVVLTSYPLLVRDRETLLRHRYSVVVLDEAQYIKNPTTHASKAAFEIQADTKIALSGTPVENHLEELWSIFRFALPGLLGGQTEFRREFRTPIEMAANRGARDRLEKRIRPFFLRRTKEQVAPELPAKTEIIDYVSLDGPQRELYEGVAIASDKHIRQSIIEKGWDESRFEALQALLRLRQICCDPRLVKQPDYESSKLERLTFMLKELSAEGRRTLVFSQFTSMLDLIEVRLKEEGIEWVRLCGSTKDRATPVQKFQSGKVPVFLISLKAGGVGLNLTAADTVIHYDPWWNPAVERQATDRAHRIGQDKPVFVYKLVAVDTVEERILQLQERKAELANQLFADEDKLASHMTPQDLHWVLSGCLD